MFACKVCLEKDKRIKDLHDEVLYLRKLSNPEINVSIPEVVREANQIMSADTHHDDPQLMDIQSEAIRLLSGNY